MFRLLPSLVVLVLALSGCSLDASGQGDADVAESHDDGRVDGDVGPTDGRDADARDAERGESDVDGRDAGDVDGDGRDGVEAGDAGCTLGAYSCVGGQLSQCLSGVWVPRETCPLGCAADATRCVELVPSNADVSLWGMGDRVLSIPERFVLDTDTGQIIDGSGSDIRPAGAGLASSIYFATNAAGCREVGIFSLQQLSVVAAGTIAVRGTRALLLLVRGDVLIEGRVIVSASAMQPGPGGWPGGAPGAMGMGPGGGNPGNGIDECCNSGGGGAGHGAIGGSGGAAGAGLGVAGGAGGVGTGVDSLTPLCGGSGGGGQLSVSVPATGGSEGGAGGGVVQISSGRRIRITGSGAIYAGGGGGAGGHPGGGGGGGSGGSILLEAPTVEMSGLLSANGGGGGGGSSLTTGHAGGDGDLGGAGGAAAGLGATGGVGGSGTRVAGLDGTDHASNGGGGGGSAGRLRINTATGVASISGPTSPEMISFGIAERR